MTVSIDNTNFWDGEYNNEIMVNLSVNAAMEQMGQYSLVAYNGAVTKTLTFAVIIIGNVIQKLWQ